MPALVRTAPAQLYAGPPIVLANGHCLKVETEDEKENEEEIEANEDEKEEKFQTVEKRKISSKYLDLPSSSCHWIQSSHKKSSSDDGSSKPFGFSQRKYSDSQLEEAPSCSSSVFGKIFRIKM